MSELSTDIRGEQAVRIRTGGIMLDGNLVLPSGATGLVLFMHGSGSSRLSPRNRFVAQALNQAGLATLLFDLLTPEEERIDLHSREYRFNIGLLADRLSGATDWVLRQPETEALRVGYFGASTGAAAALIAAAQHPNQVNAVVSRGGRPDLAGTALSSVSTPVLLMVGGNDYEVIQLNQQAFRQLRGDKELVIVEGATHLFEEPGKLTEVADIATAWFLRYLAATPTSPSSTRTS